MHTIKRSLFHIKSSFIGNLNSEVEFSFKSFSPAKTHAASYRNKIGLNMG